LFKLIVYTDSSLLPRSHFTQN